jgi:hypothetical protein
MKNVKTVTSREIKVQFNSVNDTVWARIRDAKTNEILHTGRLPYIRRVAKDRYNKTIAV